MRAGKIIRTVSAFLGAPRPIILYHKPTARCDCRCRFCDSWRDQPSEDDVLPAGEILALLDRAHAAGMTMYVVWGGEPLLAEALPGWLERARESGMRTVVCTSGTQLAARANEIGPHTERLLLSVEGVGERHDRIRGVPGLFDRIVDGLDRYLRVGHEVILWSNLSRANRDQVEPIAAFAKEHGVGVEFFPMAAYPGYNDKDLLSPEERREVFESAREQKRRGLPVLNTRYALGLMASGRSFRCNVPRLSVQVSADGRIYACDPKLVPELSPYGNLAEVDLSRLAHTPAYREQSGTLLSCNRCLLPCVADMSDKLLGQLTRKGLSRSFYRAGSFVKSSFRRGE